MNNFEMNESRIDLLKRQIRAGKDYLRRLHPRFNEERKLQEEFIQEKESELKELEKENRAKSPQLEPCPFCGRQPYKTYYYESGNAIFCHNDNCKERPQVYCRNEKSLISMWNHLGDSLESDYKECPKTSCEGCEIIGECENENQLDYNVVSDTPFDSVETQSQKNSEPEIEVPSISTKLGDGGETNYKNGRVPKWSKFYPFKLLNNIEMVIVLLGFQRDEIRQSQQYKKIQSVLQGICKCIIDYAPWRGGYNEIIALEERIREIESDKMLGPLVEQFPLVHGSHYVSFLHLARISCRKSEISFWKWKRQFCRFSKKDWEILEYSNIGKFLNRLSDWLYLEAEYFRNFEECC